MTNQIYIRLGKANKYKTVKPNKPMHPIKYFVIRSVIILGFLYFFLDDILRFVFNMFI